MWQVTVRRYWEDYRDALLLFPLSSCYMPMLILHHVLCAGLYKAGLTFRTIQYKQTTDWLLVDLKDEHIPIHTKRWEAAWVANNKQIHLATGMNKPPLFPSKPLSHFSSLPCLRDTTVRHEKLAVRESCSISNCVLLCLFLLLTLTKTKWQLALWCSECSHFLFLNPASFDPSLERVFVFLYAHCKSRGLKHCSR